MVRISDIGIDGIAHKTVCKKCGETVYDAHMPLHLAKRHRLVI